MVDSPSVGCWIQFANDFAKDFCISIHKGYWSVTFKQCNIISQIPLQVQRQQILLFQWSLHESLGISLQCLRKRIERLFNKKAVTDI